VEIQVPDSVVAGESMTVRFPYGWAGQQVQAVMHSTPVNLGTKTVSGANQISVTIPANATPGQHTLIISQNGRVLAAAQFEVAASDTEDVYYEEEVLASTGGPSFAIGVLGALAIVSGAGLLFWRRRTRQ